MNLLKGVLALFAVGVGALVIGARREMRRAERVRTRATLDDLGGCVNRLLAQFAPGSCLIATRNEGPGFLQLAVTGREAEWRQVEFGLPDADWARESFALAVATLEEGASSVRLEHNPGNADIPRFLRITLSGERSSVAERATDLLRRASVVLGFPADATYTLSREGREHPDYYLNGATLIENSTMPRWLARRMSASLRRQAEELERA